MFTLCQAPGGGHQQGKAEVGGGLGQHVRGVGGQHASSVDRGHVEVVVTDRDVGNNLQLRTCGEQRRIHPLAARGEHAHLALQALGQLLGREHMVGVVHLDIKVLAQSGDHFREHLAGDEDARAACRAGRGHQTASRSTSNSRVALGGITPPAPRAP